MPLNDLPEVVSKSLSSEKGMSKISLFESLQVEFDILRLDSNEE